MNLTILIKAPPNFSSHRQLLVVDTLGSKLVEIPCLGESPSPPVARLQSRQCGIRSVSSCPNNQFLATCGANPNNLAIYRLPDFQPFALGKASLL